MEPPAMTVDEVAAHPDAPVRITCYMHGRTLYAGHLEPDGGAEAVFAAAGCPDACPAALGAAPPEPQGQPAPPAPAPLVPLIEGGAET